MHLLVLTGFFGSGKTTFLFRALRLATRMTRMRTFLVQNEMGRVGVDPEVFRSHTLAMSELLGGCICCDLSSQFVSLLHKLATENSTDLVCVEASGIATPGMIRQLLHGTDLELLPLLQVNLLDASRLEQIEKVLSLPVIRQGIEESDICVINKMDAASAGFRERFETAVRAHHSTAHIHFTNLAASDALPGSLAAALERFLRGHQTTPLSLESDTEPQHEHEHHGHPSVCADELVVPSPFQLPSAQIRTAFNHLVQGISESGGLIGHVKVALIGSDGTRYFLNSTGSPCRESIPLPDHLSVSRIVINAIAWQIDQTTLESLTHKFLWIKPNT